VDAVISVSKLGKTYKGGLQALRDVDLTIRRGEIFALLGPNGAGKTTLISIICGIARATQGTILVDGEDIVSHFRTVRAKIGLVPQELTTDAFETVWDTVSFSRGLFGRPRDPGYVEQVLKGLSLWPKRDSKIMTLSGGMKRRVMIAKALSHEPSILFLDEPTAGVDVELRRDMWAQVRKLQESGVTIILTTHYIDEAEEMADRIGIINHGQLMLTEDKHALMKKLGTKQLTIELRTPIEALPPGFERYAVELGAGGTHLVYAYDSNREDNGISELLRALQAADVPWKDLSTTQSSLEDIFVKLVRRP